MMIESHMMLNTSAPKSSNVRVCAPFFDFLATFPPYL